MNSKERKGKIWDYLDSTGVLEKGSDEEIKSAKRTYRKNYFLEYKRKQRSAKPEFNIYFSKENGEYSRIVSAAKKHNLNVTAFVKTAALSYINQSFVVPDRLQVAKLEQLLSECLNEIKSIVKPKEKYFWQREERIELIEKRIQKLELQVGELFRNPPLVSSHDHKT